jgi:hypothetical protein
MSVLFLLSFLTIPRIDTPPLFIQPELVTAFIATACHVLSDILLFLVKLNFR